MLLYSNWCRFEIYLQVLYLIFWNPLISQRIICKVIRKSRNDISKRIRKKIMDNSQDFSPFKSILWINRPLLTSLYLEIAGFSSPTIGFPIFLRCLAIIFCRSKLLHGAVVLSVLIFTPFKNSLVKTRESIASVVIEEQSNYRHWS